MVNWAEVTTVVTITAGASGLIYQAGRLTRKIQDMGDRLAAVEQAIQKLRERLASVEQSIRGRPRR